MKYFISYTTRDKEITAAFLNVLFKSLTKRGAVFIDLINNDSIDKQKRVFDELDNSDLLILIKSPNIYKSEWVLLELERAKSRNILVVTIPLEDLISCNTEVVLDQKISSLMDQILIN